MDRRTCLGLCVGALTGGCLEITSPRRKKIAWIRLENTSDEPRGIEISIEEDGEVVFSADYRLGTSPERSTIRVDSPVDDRGRFSLYVDPGDQLIHLPPSEFADAGINEPCVGIQVTFHERETVGIELEPIREC